MTCLLNPGDVRGQEGRWEPGDHCLAHSPHVAGARGRLRVSSRRSGVGTTLTSWKRVGGGIVRARGSCFRQPQCWLPVAEQGRNRAHPRQKSRLHQLVRQLRRVHRSTIFSWPACSTGGMRHWPLATLTRWWRTTLPRAYCNRHPPPRCLLLRSRFATTTLASCSLSRVPRLTSA